MNAPDANPPCTPVKLTGNGGAGRVDPVTENDSDEDDSGEELVSKKKRKWNGRLQYRMIKQWVTGDEAVMESEDIDRELFELARDFMSASKLKKLPCHVPKPTDHAMWKQYRAYTNVRRISFRCFRCPLRHRTGCMAGIRIVEGPNFKLLEFVGEHNANSHDDDRSVYLKHDQIVAVHDAVTVAPTISAAQLRRNMQLADPDSPGKRIGPERLRSMQRRVKVARDLLTVRQLEGFNIENTYGSLGQFVASRWFRSLIDRHNDEADEFHFDLFKPFVIGRDLNAKRDIVHINITSLWFLANTLRAIGTGWVFQLNSDATFNFCRTAVDMIGFGVNSLGNHNHPLCWSIIPHNTESQVTYSGTYKELEEASLLLFSIKSCSYPGCKCCATLHELINDARVKKFVASDVFKAQKLPVDTAQCDQIQGFGNFTREEFGFDPNVCKAHLLGSSPQCSREWIDTDFIFL